MFQSNIEIQAIEKYKQGKFDSTALKEASVAIKLMNACITPIVLLRTGINSYKLLHGDFELQATQLVSDCVSCWTIETMVEADLLLKQISLSTPTRVATQIVIIENDTTSHNAAIYDAIKNGYCYCGAIHRLLNSEDDIESSVSTLSTEQVQTGINNLVKEGRIAYVSKSANPKLYRTVK